MGAVLPSAHPGHQHRQAVVRDVQMFTYGLWGGAIVDHVWMISGPWNIMNAIAGILNIVTICGWFGMFISKTSRAT